MERLQLSEDKVFDEIEDEDEYYSNDELPDDDDEDEEEDDDDYEDGVFADDEAGEGEGSATEQSNGETPAGSGRFKTRSTDNAEEPGQSSPSWIPPPLPLFDFGDDDATAYQAQTGLGYDLPEALDGGLYDARANIRGQLHDTTRARERARYCAECELREAASTAAAAGSASEYSGIDSTAVARRVGEEKEYLVYDCNARVPVDPRDGTSDSEGPPGCRDESLQFDSKFECGNLGKANRVIQTRVAGVPKGSSFSGPGADLMEKIDHEYNILCREDTATSGNIQWYYFSVRNNSAQKNLTVRFNIVNMMKKDSLYNYGMKPCVYSRKDNQGLTATGRGWLREGSSIAYHRNKRTYTKRASQNRRHYYTLTYTYTFTHADDVVFFAHCYPFSYSDLQQDVKALEGDDRIKKIMRRRQLCRTVGGNRCELLTVTAFHEDVAVLRSRAAIVISSRVHPGETNASFMMRGVINFLTSDHPAAALLREHFVFKLVPMLNPDGVINGNYRTDLMGQDLNRRYARPTTSMQPTVYAMKELLRETHNTRGVFLYVDLHGHSRKKNIFLYGCDQVSVRKMISNSSINADVAARKPGEEVAADIRHLLPEPPETAVAAHVWPYLLYSLWPCDQEVVDHSESLDAIGRSPTAGKIRPRSQGSNSASSPVPVSPLRSFRKATDQAQSPQASVSPGSVDKAAVPPLTQFFSYRDCAFKVARSKYSTGRVVAWRELGIRNAFTLESTFCGMGDNREQNTRAPDSPRAGSPRAAPSSPRGAPTSPRGELDTPREARDSNGAAGAEKVECHYSASDLEDVGRHVCESFLFYCNLNPTRKLQMMAGKQFAVNTHVDDEDGNEDHGDYSDEDDELLQSKPSLPKSILRLDSEVAAAHKKSRIEEISDIPSVVSPILTGTLFAPALAKKAAKCGCARAQAEVAIRSKIRRAMERCLLSLRAHQQAGGNISTLEYKDEEDVEEDEGDKGSDSDPSGDNLSKKELMKNPVWKSLINQGLVEKKVERKPRKKSKSKKRSKKGGEVKVSTAGATGTLLMVEKATSKLKASTSKSSSAEIPGLTSVFNQRAKDNARSRLQSNWHETFSGVIEQLAPKPLPTAAVSPKVSSIQLQMEMPSIDFQNPRRGNRVPMASRRSYPIPRNAMKGASVIRSPPTDILTGGDQSRKDARLLRMQMQGMEYDDITEQAMMEHRLNERPMEEQPPRRLSSPLAGRTSLKYEVNRLRAARSRAVTRDAGVDEPVSPLVNPKHENLSGMDGFPPLSAGARASNEVVHPCLWQFGSNMTLDQYMEDQPVSRSAMEEHAMSHGFSSGMEFMSPRLDQPRPRPPAGNSKYGASGMSATNSGNGASGPGGRSFQQEAARYRATFLEQSASNTQDQRKDPLMSLRRSIARQKSKVPTGGGGVPRQGREPTILRTSTL